MKNKDKVIKEFIVRKVITEGTNIEALVMANGIGGTPVEKIKEVSIVEVQDKGVLGWERDDAGKDHTFPIKFNSIHAIEGMTVERMAKAYKLKI